MDSKIWSNVLDTPPETLWLVSCVSNDETKSLMVLVNTCNYVRSDRVINCTTSLHFCLIIIWEENTFEWQSLCFSQCFVAVEVRLYFQDVCWIWISSVKINSCEKRLMGLSLDWVLGLTLIKLSEVWSTEWKASREDLPVLGGLVVRCVCSWFVVTQVTGSTSASSRRTWDGSRGLWENEPSASKLLWKCEYLTKF